MPKDRVQQFIELRRSLEREKTNLETRLAEISRALAQAGGTGTKPKLARPRARRGAVRRPKNRVSLKQAVSKVLAKGPLSKPEIIEGVKQGGYRFVARNPMNSLNTLLYSKGAPFKKRGGRFALGKRA